jgi:hypothetical protein
VEVAGGSPVTVSEIFLDYLGPFSLRYGRSYFPSEPSPDTSCWKRIASFFSPGPGHDDGQDHGHHDRRGHDGGAYGYGHGGAHSHGKTNGGDGAQVYRQAYNHTHGHGHDYRHEWEKLEGIVDRLEMMAGGEDEGDGGDEQTAALDQAVFEFWVVILKQKMAFKVCVNPLLHFAAVLGINDETGGWTQAKHFTASLAGLVCCGRVLMLEYIFDGQPEEVTIDMVEEFKGEYRQLMADGGGIDGVGLSTLCDFARAEDQRHRDSQGGGGDGGATG